MSRMQRAQRSCPSGATSVLESRSSSGCTLKKGETMKTTELALAVLLGLGLAPVSQAQIKHIEMHVEGMT
jgi:hypothetical protein